MAAMMATHSQQVPVVITEFENPVKPKPKRKPRVRRKVNSSSDKQSTNPVLDLSKLTIDDNGNSVGSSSSKPIREPDQKPVKLHRHPVREPDVDQKPRGPRKNQRPKKRFVVSDDEEGDPFIPNSDERCFGKFRCPKCDHQWTSGNSWLNCGQKCVPCQIMVMPWKQRPLKSNHDTDMESRTGHQEELCQKCKELGYNCRMKDGFQLAGYRAEFDPDRIF